MKKSKDNSKNKKEAKKEPPKEASEKTGGPSEKYAFA